MIINHFEHKIQRGGGIQKMKGFDEKFENSLCDATLLSPDPD